MDNSIVFDFKFRYQQNCYSKSCLKQYLRERTAFEAKSMAFEAKSMDSFMILEHNELRSVFETPKAS